MPGAIMELLRRAPLSPGKVEFAWKTAVGPALERVSGVRLEGRTLIVDAASAQWTREIARMSGVILPRMQNFLGRDTVDRIVVRPSGSQVPSPQPQAAGPRPQD